MMMMKTRSIHWSKIAILFTPHLHSCCSISLSVSPSVCQWPYGIFLCSENLWL